MENKNEVIIYKDLTEEEEIRMIKLVAESDYNKKIMQLLKDYDEGKWELTDG